MPDPLGHYYLAMLRARTEMAPTAALTVEGPAQPVPQAQEEEPMQWIIEGPEAEKLGEGLGVNELNINLIAETKAFFARIGRGFRGFFGARSVFSAPPAPVQTASAEETTKAKDKDKDQDGPEGGSGITGYMETPPAEPKNPIGGWMGSVSLDGLSMVRNHGEFFPVQPVVNVAQGAVMVVVPPPVAPAPVMYGLPLMHCI